MAKIELMAEVAGVLEAHKQRRETPQMAAATRFIERRLRLVKRFSDSGG
jgi:hypothetical protein